MERTVLGEEAPCDEENRDLLASIINIAMKSKGEEVLKEGTAWLKSPNKVLIEEVEKEENMRTAR